MAERRMFAKSIIDSDLFLDMPATTQNLYFHLAMRADDDGFVNAPQKIMRMVSCSKNDFDMLVFKNFIIPFETGVCVIKHWRIHNYIRKDRYTPTIYAEEKNRIYIDDTNLYTVGQPPGIPYGLPNPHFGQPNEPFGQPPVIPVDDVGKVRLGKEKSSSGEDPFRLFQNEIGVVSGTMSQMLQELVLEHGNEQVCYAIREAVRQGKRKLSYVEGILKRTKTDGRDDRPKNVHHLPTPEEIKADEERRKIERQAALRREMFGDDADVI